MNRYYVYDADGDCMVDDCAYLGSVDADTLEDAAEQARAIWPAETNLRIAC